MKNSKSVGAITDLFKNSQAFVFDKEGLEAVNASPNSWELGKDNTFILTKNNEIIVKPSRRQIIGELILLGRDLNIQISDISLIRLDDITEDMAIMSGVENIGDNIWRHYAPELFYPKKILINQDPGYPHLKTAKSSLISLWCKRYGMMDIYTNPWIWKYTIIEESKNTEG